MFPKILACVALFLLFVCFSEPAFAGPGGKIASAVFDTFLGKIVLGLLTVFFLPLILLMVFREKMAERRSRKDLKFMAKHHSNFDWLMLKHRAKDCFMKVHSGWENEDLSEVSDWMTDWYWQNQQMAYLNRWQEEGLVNICKVKKINYIRPVLFVHRNDHGETHEGSMIMIAIEARMKDYLQERHTSKVVEGSKRFKDIETVWTLIIDHGKWKVADIEEGAMTQSYSKMMKDLPKIESTLLSQSAL